MCLHLSYNFNGKVCFCLCYFITNALTLEWWHPASVILFSMFSPFAGMFLFSFIGVFSVSPKNILKNSCATEPLSCLVSAFCSCFFFLPTFEFHILSYFLLLLLSDRTLYASFISLKRSSYWILWLLISGWYFLACSLNASFISLPSYFVCI